MQDPEYPIKGWQLWLARMALLLATLILAAIARKNILDPAAAAAASSMALQSPLAFTNMRASFGAFPLGCALFTLTCLTRRRLYAIGLYFVMALIGTALLIRGYGVIVDGTIEPSLRVLLAESVIFLLSAAALTGLLRAKRSGLPAPEHW
jgi:hypothetical protein